MNDRRKLPRLPSVKRLPSYLHELKLMRDNQQQVVSTAAGDKLSGGVGQKNLCIRLVHMGVGVVGDDI